MRTLQQCLKGPSLELNEEERLMIKEWIDEEARYLLDPVDYCFLLGWFVLDEHIPLSPKEAGF